MVEPRLAYLALFSTIVAFLLQLVGQRHLSPTSATTILLLETPIAVITAMLRPGEPMAGMQWLGAASPSSRSSSQLWASHEERRKRRDLGRVE